MRKFLLISTILAFGVLALRLTNISVLAQPTEESIAIGAPSSIGKTFPALPENYSKNFQMMNARALSGRIAFTATVGEFDRLLILDLDSARIRKLVDGPGNNSFPAWSNDGKKVAFVSDRDGNKEIYLADWDGSNQQRLTFNQVVDDNPTWSANDQYIVFNQDDSPVARSANSNVMQVDILSGQISQITNFKKRNTVPKVSPDGHTISYTTSRFWPGWDVCFWHIAGKNESCPLTGKNSFCRASWSPSGKMLAYSTGNLDQVDIATLNLESGAQVMMTDMVNKEYDPVWSPSEALLLFASEVDIKDIYNLYTVDMQKKINPLLKSTYSLRYPSWSAAKTFELEAARIREQELKDVQAEAAVQDTTTVETITPNPKIETSAE